ncbi:DNRLRE domain-containing protein [Streptomyces sp. NPDC057291]|uniref:DNRLRE domain-containing protein n=1 Tax=Streptomyces sp. NPDC057291 TaxID=3346087 RepID=UPI003638556B
MAEAALMAQASGLAIALSPAVGEPATKVATASAHASGPAEAADESAARLKARTQHRRIEVLGDRTADSTTWALPSGSLQTEAYSGPIRIKKDGAWAGINTALADAGAALEPKAAAADIAVSDGGDHLLASVTKGAASFGLGWADTLPTPSIKGDTATYDLGGGQKLTATALAQGFSQNITLAQAPNGPVSYRMPLALKGLTLSKTASGHLLLKNTNGKLVAEASAPMMWDASKDPASGESAHVAKVATEIETSADDTQTLVLTPDAEFLARTDLTWPVTVDPTTTLGVSTDTWLQTPDYTSSQRGSEELKSGTYDAGSDVARSYLQFDVAKFKGKHITDTNLGLYSYYSSTCSTSGAGTQVRRVTADWDPSAITWGAQPATTTTDAVTNTAALGYSSSCPGGWMNFDVDGIVQTWANGTANYGLRIAGASETDSLTWRRFRSANYAADTALHPTLTVTYNSYPSVPSGQAVSPSTINAYNGNRYVTSLTPTLSAKVTDGDGGTVKAQFEVTPDPAYADTTYTYTGTSAAVASGGAVQLAIPSANAFPAGSHLRYRMRGYDSTDYGAWTGYSTFVLNTALPVAPTVSCPPYPANTWSTKAAGAVTCTLDTTSTDGQGYLWGLDDPNTPKRIDDTTNGNGGDALTVSITPGDGWHSLYAKTIDSGGNLSTAATKYSFGVGADGAALLSPADGDRPARRVALAATSKPTYTGVTYQYRRGEADAWQNVPVAAVTKNSDGTPVTAWPVPAPNGAPPALTWSLTTTLTEDGPVDVRASFTDGTTTGFSPASTVVVDRNAGTAPSEQVGPGQVNHLTGDYLLSATDASAFGLSVGRFASSRRPTAGADAEGQAAIFGPQWTSGTAAEASESIWTFVRKTSATSVEVIDAHGGLTGFTATTAGGWKAEPGAEDFTLTGAFTSSFTLKENDGTTTTFAKVDAAATTWQATTTYRASSNTTTTVVSEKVVSGSTTLARPKLVIAPTSAVSAATCASAPSTKGCRVLQYVYATATTATATTLGDYAGQVSSIRLFSTEPGAATGDYKTVQAYTYDTSGRLREAWNPRISPALKTQYTYDSAGRITQLTPPGELPWTFVYGKAGNTATAGDGMLLKASRPTLIPGSRTQTNGTATTTVVYDVPLSGAKAPYAMGGSDVAAWGQTNIPTDATAVFPADAVPAANDGAALTASSYARASISYVDASGRQVNTAVPGGHIGVAEFDNLGNLVRELTASNRKLALATSGTQLTELTRLGIDALPSADRAQQLSTTTVYSATGQRRLEEFGPLHLVTLNKDLAAGAGGIPLVAGTEVPARQHTVNTFDEGRPTDGSATVSDQITTTRVGAHIEGYPTDGDVLTTATTYDWVQGLETSEIQDPGGLNIIKRTVYDASGRVIKTMTPMSSGSDALTQVTTYWSATGTGPCNGRPEWADLVCSVGPAGTVTGSGSNPAQLPTDTTEYDWWGNAAKVTRAANGTTRTTTSTFDDAQRVVQVSVSGGGDSVPDTTTTYDAKTGEVSAVSAGGHTVTHTYDDLGREVGYDDGTGNVTSRQYDAQDRPTLLTDSAPSTTTYTYDTTVEPRGLLTRIDDSDAGSFSGSYDAEGNLETENLPGGYQLTTTRDTTGADTARTYTNTNDQSVPLAENAAYTVHGTVREHTNTTGVSSTSSVLFDAAGRAAQVDQVTDLDCTRAVNRYNNDGSMTQQTKYDSDCASIDTASGVTTSFTYDSADRPVDSGYSYDTLGRQTSSPDGTSTKYFANDVTSQETAAGQRKTWTPDAEGRLATRVIETQNPDSTWTTTSTSTDHYAQEGGEPTWATLDDGSTTSKVRNILDLTDQATVTSSGGSMALQLTDLSGDTSVQIPIQLTRSGSGSSSLWTIAYDLHGASIPIPAGCYLEHWIVGHGRYIDYELADVSCSVAGYMFAKFCNTRIDFSYYTVTNRKYRLSRGATHYTCYRGHVPRRYAPGDQWLPYQGKVCAQFFVNSYKRAYQCLYIHN